jgi:hypothetical protein
VTDEDAKRLALRLILEAWDAARGQGVKPELLASAAMFAALTDMVDLFGETPVAQFCEDLPDRVLRGEFTLERPGARS